jgi:hypothetical protein
MIKLITEKQQPQPGYSSPHYRVNDCVFYSKLDALNYCDQNNVEWPTFQVWNHTNGYARPAESFWQLTVAAAEQLGHEHDAVRLWYSGGTDSHAVLEAMLQAGHPPKELAMYRRFIGAVDESVNVEVDVFPVKDFLYQTLKRYGVDIPLRVYDILPEHTAWYMQDPGVRWFRHKTCWPISVNCIFCHEIYPELQNSTMTNVSGSATPTVSNGEFYWLDTDFNLNFMTPRMVHFFADPRWPQLAAAYAYGIHDCAQRGIYDVSIGVKRELGFPPLGNMLGTKWIWPRVNGELVVKNDWRHCKKEILLLSNAHLSAQGKDTLSRMEHWLSELAKNTRWFNHGDIFQDYVGSVSEKHKMEDIM